MEAFSEVFNFKKCQSNGSCSKIKEILLQSQTQINFQKIRKTDRYTNYHKNSLKSIRSAIDRSLQDIRRSTDIVRDKEFKSANHTLDHTLDWMLKAKKKNWCIKLPTTNLSLILKTLNKLLLTPIPLLIIQLFFDNVCDITRLYILLLVG